MAKKMTFIIRGDGNHTVEVKATSLKNAMSLGKPMLRGLFGCSTFICFKKGDMV